MELQEKYKIRYKGRKGRKKLQAIEEEIERLHRETGGRYDDYEELKLLESMLPDPEVRLYFLKYYSDLELDTDGSEFLPAEPEEDEADPEEEEILELDGEFTEDAQEEEPGDEPAEDAETDDGEIADNEDADTEED